MNKVKGNIEIHSENIFPIIKKWLYSDKDIFARELVSNGCDAITKLKKLVSLGEAKVEETDYRINVYCDKKNKTLTFEDNGIGMTEDEVKKYINQVAFSSAEEFMEKFKSEGDDAIIGHFGLGFYSSFMVAKKVEINTLSYQEDAQAVKWSCEGETDYTMEESDRSQRGTAVTIYLDDNSKEYMSKYAVSAVLRKYCSFLPYPIFVEQLGEEEKEGEEKKEPTPINDTTPLWLKAPADITDEEYKAFYHKVFSDYNDPIFWIHLNVDFPFVLKGILYFPKLSHQFDSIEGQIKLYNNQVFVADNIKEIIPEFLMILKGVLDCPDLPLNVGRSFLQNDKEVQKIPTHIVKKVADKLKSLYKTERENYETYWMDIHPFVKYGCIRDENFAKQAEEYVLIKNQDDKYVALPEFLPTVEEGKEAKVYYTTNVDRQKAQLELYKEANIPVGIFDTMIDPHFIQHLEMKNQGLRFVRIDSETPDELKDEVKLSDADKDSLTKAFQRASGKEKLNVDFEALKSVHTIAAIKLDENMQRMQESNMFGMGNMDFIKDQAKLVLNTSSPVVEKILEKEKSGEAQDEICLQIYDLARLTSGMMEQKELSTFIERSQKLIEKLVNDDE
ncbi:MAG: molecular chaperone HtpG [Clostridia bacterium]|nr:molecular chaperone HtpG [Clostridia bacterium]